MMSAHLPLVLIITLVGAGSSHSRTAGGHHQGSEPPWPQVARVTPSSGPPGTQVTITGLNFKPGATVLVGGVAATVQEVRGDRITAIVGPHKPGRVSVEVENLDHRSGVRGWAFRYLPSGA